MTRRRLFGLSLAPLLAPLAALWPWRKREEPFYLVAPATEAELSRLPLLVVMNPQGCVIPWDQSESRSLPIGYAERAAQEGETVAVRWDPWPRA